MPTTDITAGDPMVQLTIRIRSSDYAKLDAMRRAEYPGRERVLGPLVSQGIALRWKVFQAQRQAEDDIIADAAHAVR